MRSSVCLNAPAASATVLFEAAQESLCPTPSYFLKNCPCFFVWPAPGRPGAGSRQYTVVRHAIPVLGGGMKPMAGIKELVQIVKILCRMEHGCLDNLLI
jgi:hypothetical protein